MPTTNGAFQQFGAADEGPHPVLANPLWQESVLLHWYDRTQVIGGWHRIGHEANNQGGRAALWSFLFDRQGWQYRRCGEVALAPSDRLVNGFGAGPALGFSYQDGAALWRIDDGPLAVRLECRNLFPLVDPFPKSDELAAKRFASHFEVAGHVSGEVSYRGGPSGSITSRATHHSRRVPGRARESAHSHLFDGRTSRGSAASARNRGLRVRWDHRWRGGTRSVLAVGAGGSQHRARAIDARGGGRFCAQPNDAGDAGT